MQTDNTKRKAAKTGTLIRLAPALWVCFAFAANGQQQTRTAAPPADETVSVETSQAPTLLSRNPRYRLHSGDVLDLNFPYTPEFNQTITVQPDGYVNLRGAGDLRIQDKTVPDVVEAVRITYENILRDPVVTVELKEFEKPYFIVGGEVEHPGKYDLRGDTTILQAIAMAGNFKPQSKSSQVLVFRRVSDAWAETRQFDVKQMLRTRNLDEDVHLRSGDMVYIPKSAWAKFEHFIPVPSLGVFFNPFSF